MEGDAMEIGEDISSSGDGLQVPFCDVAIKPYIGQRFDTLLEGIEFYKTYAKACGFEVRLGTSSKTNDGTIRSKYALCNREGIWEVASEQITSNEYPKIKKRKTSSCRVDCKAKIIFQISTGGRYRIRLFDEGHTHLMVPAATRHLMPSNRQVDDVQQMLIISAIKANVGPMRAFRMYKEIIGNYEDVGCTSDDFKNYVRDLKVYSKGSDAQMLLEAFTNKQDLGGGFKFCHDIDEENKLRRLFWTDEISIKNFKLFGEAVSFDATYNTNK